MADLVKVVKCNPLNWDGPKPWGLGPQWTAPALTTGYRISDRVAGRTRYVLTIIGQSKQLGSFPTLEKAMAAAQDDMERRVEAALTEE